MADAPGTNAGDGRAAKGRKVPKLVACATHGCLEGSTRSSQRDNGLAAGPIANALGGTMTPALLVSFFQTWVQRLLYAPISAERDERPLGVLSALARLNVDLWEETGLNYRSAEGHCSAEIDGSPRLSITMDRDPLVRRLARAARACACGASVAASCSSMRTVGARMSLTSGIFWRRRAAGTRTLWSPNGLGSSEKAGLPRGAEAIHRLRRFQATLRVALIELS